MSNDKINTGGPAFPSPYSLKENQGMTLRDYFAAKALQGCLAYSIDSPQSGNYHTNCDPDNAARSAYAYADAMLKAREES